MSHFLKKSRKGPTFHVLFLPHIISTTESDWRLLLIAEHRNVGSLPGGHEVFCITRIVILPLADAGHPELDIEVNNC